MNCQALETATEFGFRRIASPMTETEVERFLKGVIDCREGIPPFEDDIQYLRGYEYELLQMQISERLKNEDAFPIPVQTQEVL